MQEKHRTRSIEQIVDDQVRRWEMSRKERKKEALYPVVTFSRESGSGGTQIAELLANRLGFDLFHQNIVHKMAESSRLSAQLLESLDEEGLSIVKEWLMGFSENFWPDKYLKQLVKVVGTMGRQGRAVIIGRGAQFILPQKRVFRVRVVAPAKVRIANTAKEQKISAKEAEQQVIKTDSERRAFIRKYFYTDIDNPYHYDLILNTEKIALATAVQTVHAALEHHVKSSSD